MKGIIFDIKRFAIHDGPGIRQSIFFKGCPLSCWWCHNPESREIGINVKEHTPLCSDATVGYSITIDELMKLIMKDEVFYKHSNGGVTFSGGEPTLQIDFLRSMLIQSQKKGIHTALDTSGFVSREKLETIVELVDLFLYDIKHIEADKHKLLTGVSNDLILSNLKYLNALNKEIYIRFPLLPGVNNSFDHLRSMARYVGKLKNVKQLNILPFHKMGQAKYKKFNIKNTVSNIIPPNKEDLQIARNIFEAENLTVVIGG